MRVVTLSGWGMAPEMLSGISMGIAEAQEIPCDYLQLKEVREVFAQLERLYPDIVIGWSMGGQLALAAAEAKAITPRGIIVLGAARRFVHDEDEPGIMDEKDFTHMCDAFEANPEVQWNGFVNLMLKGDSLADAARKAIKRHTASEEQHVLWLKRLSQLPGKLTRRRLPPVYGIYGLQDRIVPAPQARALQRATRASLSWLPRCGHMLYPHAPEEIRRSIAAWVANLKEPLSSMRQKESHE